MILYCSKCDKETSGTKSKREIIRQFKKGSHWTARCQKCRKEFHVGFDFYAFNEK